MKNFCSGSRQKIKFHQVAEAKQLSGNLSYAVLLDFKSAQASMSGIGQDTRLILSALQNIAAVKHIALLLYPKFLGNGNFKIFTHDVATQSKGLYHTLDLNNQHSSRHFAFLSKVLRFAEKSYGQIVELFKRSCAVMEIDRSHFAGVLYRNLFPSHEISIEDAFKKTDVLIGNFSRQKMLIYECLLKRVPFFKKVFRLNTTSYDFFITQYWNTFEIAESTTLIIRAHDTVPITDLDTVTCKANYFAMLVKRNADKAYFACNSKPVEKKILKLAPQLAGRTFVAPCAVSDFYKKTLNLTQLQSTCMLHWSAASLKKHGQTNISSIREKIATEIKLAKSLNYILFVSTIEPRKNLQSLIEAWYPLYVSHGLRLLICGNEGWHSKNVLSQMSNLVEASAIIHLEQVQLHDMPLLYSHARAFISPSYAEGFGLPVVEAMRCECPIAIADIEEYRWVAGSAAVYFDPYDVQDMRKQIYNLLFEKNSEVLRKKLVHDALIQSERYTVKAVSQCWQEMLNKISNEKTVVGRKK